MACCHLYAPTESGDHAFSVDTTAIVFGRGSLSEIGEQAQRLGLVRVAILTDPQVRQLRPFEVALASLRAAAVDFVIYDEVAIEPTDASFRRAAEHVREAKVDGFISIGGGSVIDTAKAANLYSTYPAEFLTYVNAPVGAGAPIPGPLRPHIACPTTSGTGSECTGIAVFDLLERSVKTGIANPWLKPTRAIIDPDATDTLPSTVVAASGFDVLSHALESLTARPFSRRPRGASRPMSQGANPWSDIGCREALRLCGAHLVRAVREPTHAESREKMMWAATLAGIAFGNAGVHIPHGMAYSVAGMVETYRPPDYPGEEAMVPHGISVIVNAPAVFERTAPIRPERHLEGAALLGADVVGAGAEDAGAILRARLAELMRACDLPNGLAALGYRDHHVARLTEGAWAQQRLLSNAPLEVDQPLLADLYRGSMACW